MSEPSRIQTREGIKGVEKAIALEAAKGYCTRHGYSMHKLAENRFHLIGGVAVFSVPSPVKPNGLMNDRETQPLPTLILRQEDGKLRIETTEYTEKYLK